MYFPLFFFASPQPPFEFNLKATPHTTEAIALSQHVANVFVR